LWTIRGEDYNINLDEGLVVPHAKDPTVIPKELLPITLEPTTIIRLENRRVTVAGRSTNIQLTFTNEAAADMTFNGTFTELFRKHNVGLIRGDDFNVETVICQVVPRRPAQYVTC